MKTELTSKISNAVAKAGYQLRKQSPKILISGGIIGVVGSAVLACMATLKVNPILEKTRDDLTMVRETATPEEEKKELTMVYLRAGVQLAQLYLPAVGVGALSLAGIIGANTILSKRNAAMAAAYAAVSGGFKEYRDRVAERYGADAEQELRYDIHTEKIEETVTGEDGKTKKVKKSVQVIGADGVSDYARFFDTNTSEYWIDDPDYNMMLLKAQQSLANNQLNTRGYVFLNDVYDMLGIDRSLPGQIVGWMRDETREKADDDCKGDGYIDFGIREMYVHNEHGELVPTIFLDFNVDGNIWERAVHKNLMTD